MSELDERFKSLEKSHVRYFMGQAIPIYETDRTSLFWLFLFIAWAIFGLTGSMSWITLIIFIAGSISLIIYYSSKIENLFIRKYIRQNYPHIAKETEDLNKQIEKLIQMEIPKVYPDLILATFLDKANLPKDIKGVKAFSILLKKEFLFSEVLPYSCNRSFLGRLVIQKAHSHLECSIQAWFRQSNGKEVYLGNYFRDIT